MRHHSGWGGRSLAALAAGAAVAAMSMLAVSGGPVSAADDELELPMPGVGPTEAQEAGDAGPGQDRDSHSFAPQMPSDICDDPTKTCGFAETH